MDAIRDSSHPLGMARPVVPADFADNTDFNEWHVLWVGGRNTLSPYSSTTQLSPKSIVPRVTFF